LPKNIRGSSFAIIYAVSIATFGGTCQLVVTWLIHVTGNPMAPVNGGQNPPLFGGIATATDIEREAMERSGLSV
jgi:hypothetical protein